MNKIKYILSVIIVICTTILVLLLPGEYFKNYSYEEKLEDMESEDYASIEESNASTDQIFQLLDDGNFTENSEYMIEALSDAEQENNKNYKDMVKEVFNGYMIQLFRADSVELLSEYMGEWKKEIDDWYVDNVKVINVAGMYNKQMVYAKLYEMRLGHKQDESKRIDVMFNAETKTFYQLTIMDSRYELEKISESLLQQVLIQYLNVKDEVKNNSEGIREDEINPILSMKVVTAPGTIIINIQ